MLITDIILNWLIFLESPSFGAHRPSAEHHCHVALNCLQMTLIIFQSWCKTYGQCLYTLYDVLLHPGAELAWTFLTTFLGSLGSNGSTGSGGCAWHGPKSWSLLGSLKMVARFWYSSLKQVKLPLHFWPRRCLTNPNLLLTKGDLFLTLSLFNLLWRRALSPLSLVLFWPPQPHKSLPEHGTEIYELDLIFLSGDVILFLQCPV